MMLNILSPQLADQILDEAVQLLSEPGVRVHNGAALDRLAAAVDDIAALLLASNDHD